MNSQYLMIGICGEPSSGKTTIIKTIRKDAKILILDLEGGLSSIFGWLEMNKFNVMVKKISTYEEICELKKWGDSDISDFDYIVVDTLTYMYQIISRWYIKDNQKVANTNERQHYNQMPVDIFDILNNFKSLKANFIFLMHTKNYADNFQQRFVQLEFVGNQVQPIINKALDFIFYIMKNPSQENQGGEQRVLVTKNLTIPAPDNRILEFCKKRDEFHVINAVVNANIDELLTNFVNNRNKFLKEYQLREIKND